MKTLTDRRQLWLFVAALMVADLISSLETAMLYVAIPEIARDTGDMVGVGWLLTGFSLMQAVSAGLGGRLGDIYGRRRVLNILLLCCVFGSVICVMSPNFNWIIFGRILQGTSGAILPLCFGLLKEHAPAKEVPFLVGILAGAYAASGAVGFMAGALFAQYGHWQQIFLMTAVLPFVGIACALAWVPKDHREPTSQRLDWVGGMLFAPAIALVLISLGNGKNWGWASPLTLGSLAAGLALCVFWVYWELRQKDPLINIRLLANRQVALGNAIYAATGLGAVQLVYVILLLLQQPVATGIGLGVTAVMAAALKLPGNVCSGLGGPLAGFLAKQGRAKTAAIWAGCVLVVSWLAVIVNPNSMWVALFTLCISSLGVGMILSIGPNLILEVTPEARSSEVTGMAVVLRAASFAIGAQMCTVLLTSSQVMYDGTLYPSAEGYLRTFWYITATCAAIVLLALALKSPKSQPAADTLTSDAGLNASSAVPPSRT